MERADVERLAALRIRDGWSLEIQALAADAASTGQLRQAWEFAEAQRMADPRSSSNSSVTFLVSDGPMKVRANPTFCDLLRSALLDAMGRAGRVADEGPG